MCVEIGVRVKKAHGHPYSFSLCHQSIIILVAPPNGVVSTSRAMILSNRQIVSDFFFFQGEGHYTGGRTLRFNYKPHQFQQNVSTLLSLLWSWLAHWRVQLTWNICINSQGIIFCSNFKKGEGHYAFLATMTRVCSMVWKKYLYLINTLDFWQCY